MVRLNPPFDIRVNFWDQNDAMRLIEPFDELYDRDETDDKDKSSREMWCLWLSTSPHEYNPIKRLTRKDKLSAIKKYYPYYDEEDDLLISAKRKFESLTLSPVAKAYKEEEESLIKRSALIQNLQDRLDLIAKGEYRDKETGEKMYDIFDKDVQSMIKTLETIRKNTLSVYKQYEEVKGLFESEQAEEILHGGGKLNPMEKAMLPDLEEE